QETKRAEPRSLLHPRRRNPIAELQAIDDVHAANHLAERGEVSLVVRLWRVAQSVTGAASVEPRGCPTQVPARQPATVDLVTQHSGVGDRTLLCDEVRNDAAELRADDLAGLDNLDEVVDRERRVSRIQLELDGAARRLPYRSRLRRAVVVRHDPALDNR